MDNPKNHFLITYSVNHPKKVTAIMLLSTLLFMALAVLPSLWPAQFPILNGLAVDTDPENMLPHDEPVRAFHHEMKKTFSLHDLVVVGVVNDQEENGVFNPASLARVYALTEFAKTLSWPVKNQDPAAPEKPMGVIGADILAPSLVDNITQGGLGTVNFSYLMPQPPKTEAEALAVRDQARHIPLLNGSMISTDGKALALYIPISDKKISYRVRAALLEEIDRWPASEDVYHITGLPVAEDTFGVEMFYQMAISAPLAMLVIFLLLWWFFKKPLLIFSPMIVAMVAALSAMSLLVISGHTIHIMSSMIPIFIMPIAVLDAIHILSDFFDRYGKTRDRRKTILGVMSHLYTPMLFTSLTTMAGFGSLALTPIPPVQVFGLYITVGVLLAWFWTITFIPAFIMLIPEEKLAGFGYSSGEDGQPVGLLGRFLGGISHLTYHQAHVILGAVLVLVVVAGVGISRININDNPIKWFDPNHDIRVADRVLNEHFAGTYLAYLALLPPEQVVDLTQLRAQLRVDLTQRQAILVADQVPNAAVVFSQLEGLIETIEVGLEGDFLATLSQQVEKRVAAATDDDYEAWDEALLFVDQAMQAGEIFKDPKLLRYMERLQNYLVGLEDVGKVNSLVGIVKTVYRELMAGQSNQFRIPDTRNGVAQTLLTYQNSHRPHDLFHFVSPDYRQATLMLQLTSGDNQDMAALVEAVASYVAINPPPVALEAKWFGLTYINVVWQDRMVAGMAEALAGSFVVVLVMMAVLFRSIWWGALAMVPLTITVGLIYGVIGLIGKDYDMPVAVLSALSLGLAVDYAIHFLARARDLQQTHGSWQAALGAVFGEPARAISRNVIVVGAGFLPLLAAPLVPYQTVGIFIAAILLVAGVASLLILPALITLFQTRLFPTTTVQS